MSLTQPALISAVPDRADEVLYKLRAIGQVLYGSRRTYLRKKRLFIEGAGILLVNGFPLVVIEAKTPVRHAFGQEHLRVA